MIASNEDVGVDEVMQATKYKNRAHVREVMKKEEVTARVYEIQRMATKLDIITLEQRLKLLSDMAQDTDETTANRIKAIESLCKITDKTGASQVDGEGIPQNIIQPVILKIPDNER